MSTPALQAHFQARRGAFTMDASFAIAHGGVTGLVGRSGAGKTTLLRFIAGLERPDEGRLVVEGMTWQDSTTRTFLPTHRRPIGYVFQEPDLFPHLSVSDNLRYAERRSRKPSVQRDDAIAWLGLATLMDRTTTTLSGGERQRVAIARALLSGPTLLLLDEPLSALDEPGRRDVLPYITALPRTLSIPIIYVSHALTEVARIAHELIWLDGGRVRASGPAIDVAARTDFARWRGAEAGALVEAHVGENDSAFGLTQLQTVWGPLWVRHRAEAAGTPVRVEVQASDVSIALRREEGSSIMNQLPMRIIEIIEDDADAIIRLAGDADVPSLLARVTRRSAHDLGLAAGARVFARIKSVAVLE